MRGPFCRHLGEFMIEYFTVAESLFSLWRIVHLPS
jgi:hypothetical protein